jgi:hypothetical protein
LKPHCILLLTEGCCYGSDMPGRTPPHTEKRRHFLSTNSSDCFLKQCGIRIHYNFVAAVGTIFIEIHESCIGDINDLLHSSGYALKEIEERYDLLQPMAGCKPSMALTAVCHWALAPGQAYAVTYLRSTRPFPSGYTNDTRKTICLNPLSFTQGNID